MGKFLPGVSGNPKGGKAHDPIKRRIKRLTSEELEEIFNDILMGSPEDLKQMVKSEDANILKVWIGNVISKAINKGDPAVLFALLDRLVGKVSDKLRITKEIDMGPQVVLYIPKNGSEAPEEAEIVEDEPNGQV